MNKNLKKYNPIQFLQAWFGRSKKINSEVADPMPKMMTYSANKIMRAFHPVNQTLKIVDITAYGDNVKTFTLAASGDTKQVAYFAAGQYLTIFLQIGEAKISRPYSISSSPKMAEEKNAYQITVKRAVGGLASEYILDNWTIGDEVTAAAPEGVFTYEPLRDASTIVGLAGGSGITPFLSLATSIADGDEDANLVLLYGSRNENEILFKDKFDEIMKSTKKVKVIHVLSDSGEGDGYEHGFITAELIKKYAPKSDYSVFICGPQAMYNFLDKEIVKLGLRDKYIRHEVFGEFHSATKAEDYPKGVGSSFNITVIKRGETVTIKADATDSILSGIEKAGITAPARCRSGICGWCRARLVSGQVYIPKNLDGRRLADADFGYIHPCCTFPISDITIDISAAK